MSSDSAAGVASHQMAAGTHGRYLVSRPAGDGPFPVLAGFHGYAENAGIMLKQLEALGGGGWLLVSIQALNRFYNRSNAVVANWMTSEDRELAIADNVAYVASVIAAVRRDYRTRRPLVYAGFSQGVAMAYRAAAFGGHPCDALVVLAGDVPPDVAPHARSLPRVLLGRGAKEEWYTEAKAAADLSVLRAAGVDVTEHVFDAGHVWEASFVQRARDLLATL